MLEINRSPPESMTVDERVDEVCALLSRGLLRLWQSQEQKIAPVCSPVTSERQFGLGFGGQQRVHTNPSNSVTESI
jgi:hypothetical protein